MVETFTRSVTNTYTEARARYVMGKVYEDLVSLMLTGIITQERAERIRADILYLLSKDAVRFFELQFMKAGTKIGGLRYVVKSDSSVSSDTESGSINFWTLDSAQVAVLLFVELNYSSYHIAEVNRQIAAWGWGTGLALTQTAQQQNTYSKDGFGLQQLIIGKW